MNVYIEALHNNLKYRMSTHFVPLLQYLLNTSLWYFSKFYRRFDLKQDHRNRKLANHDTICHVSLHFWVCFHNNISPAPADETINLNFPSATVAPHQLFCFTCMQGTDKQSQFIVTLQWRHNEREGVSNHQPHDCLLKRLFRRRSKKTSKLCVTGLCEENSPETGEFPAQRAS